MLFCGDEDIVVMLLLICTCAFHDVLQLQYRLSIIAIFLLFNRTSHKDKGRFAAVLLLMAVSSPTCHFLDFVLLCGAGDTILIY